MNWQNHCVPAIKREDFGQLFQTVSMRTAGFASLDCCSPTSNALTISSRCFLGGAPGTQEWKITTFLVLLLLAHELLATAY